MCNIDIGVDNCSIDIYYVGLGDLGEKKKILFSNLINLDFRFHYTVYSIFKNLVCLLSITLKFGGFLFEKEKEKKEKLLAVVL